jgi:hypothetical protein
MPSRSELARQRALLDARARPPGGVLGDATIADLVTAIATLQTTVALTNTALAAINALLTTANGILANIKTNTDRIP